MGSSDRGGKGSDSTGGWRHGSLEVVSLLVGWLALKLLGEGRWNVG